MRNNISDYELDKMLRLYMESETEQAFPLDKARVFKNADARRNMLVLKKRISLAASLLLLLISVFTVPQASAAILKLFTYIPGIGIIEKNDSAIYAIVPVVRSIEADSGMSNTQVHAYLENAIYSDGYLNTSITVTGRFIDFKDFTLYINGRQIGYQSGSGASSGAQHITKYEMWLKTQEPEKDDVYEIEIAGFAERLSFTLVACSEYDSLTEIGPTDIQNNISITTTASRAENKLTVWCYPFNTTSDKITGIGNPHTSIWENEAYIETESGFTSVHSSSGTHIMERLMFDIPADDNSAVLHIPYLTLTRDEKKKLTVPVPSDYISVECDISAEFSLGTLRITGVERKPDQYDSSKDTLRINFTLSGNDSGIVFNSFTFQDAKGYPLSHMRSYNAETGCLEYIEADIGTNDRKILFTISELCYYLLGEYVIPLDTD